MRNLLTVCAVVCVVLLAASFATAANPGQVPHNTLSQMGLAGLQPMTDLEGSTVHAKGFVTAGGSSIAVTPNASSNYSSYAQGYHYASVSSSAAAVTSFTTTFGNITFGAMASGYATAVAH
jgi:hypothetical protein